MNTTCTQSALTRDIDLHLRVAACAEDVCFLVECVLNCYRQTGYLRHLPAQFAGVSARNKSSIKRWCSKLRRAQKVSTDDSLRELHSIFESALETTSALGSRNSKRFPAQN